MPVRDAQTLVGSDLNRPRARRPGEPDRELSSPLLNVDQREVVERPLHAVTIGIELLERRDRPAPVAALQPDSNRERMVAIERGAVAEADLGVAVEVHRLADHAAVESWIAGHDVPMPVVTRDVREIAVELVVRDEPLAVHAHRRRTDGRLPLLLEGRDDILRQRVFVRLDGGLERRQLRPLLVARQLHEGHGVSTLAVEAFLGHAVEEREELVELLLRDRIELVRVAPRTAHGQAHERVGRGLDAIDDVFDLVLRRNGAALEVHHVIPVEPGGDLLRVGGVWQQIARDLVDGELVEREIPVERVDHPVAPVPHLAQAVDVIPVGVGVARSVEPGHGHALAVVRRFQQGIDARLVGIWRSIRRGRRRSPRASAGVPSDRR